MKGTKLIYHYGYLFDLGVELANAVDLDDQEGKIAVEKKIAKLSPEDKKLVYSAYIDTMENRLS